MKKIIIPDGIESVDTDVISHQFKLDPRGFFLIKLDKDTIEVGHVDLESYKMNLLGLKSEVSSN